MKTAIKSRWDGGVSDPREVSTVKCTSIRNFYPQKSKLTPYRDTVTETIDSGVLADFKLTDVIRFNYTGDTTKIFALGQKASGDTTPSFYQKSDATGNLPTASFQLQSNGQDSSGTVIPGTLIGYKGDQYCLKTKSGSTYLVKHSYGSAPTEIGAVGYSPTGSPSIVPKMFIHPKDNRLYMASGYTAASFDGTTIYPRDFSTGHNINAICPQGNNVILGQVNKSDNSSVLGIWSGSTTSSTLVDVVEFGNDAIILLENIGDVVIGVSTASVGNATDVGTQNAVTIRAYAGGAPEIIKKIESVGPLGSRVYALKAKRNGVLYFPMSAYLNGTRTYQIWEIYKNESGLWTVNPDRKVNNDTEITTDITGFSMIGDYMWVAFSDGSFRRTDDQEHYTATSIWESLINDSMPIEDRTKLKKLKSVSFAKSSTLGQLVLKYSVDGSSFVTIGTLTSGGKLVKKGTNESDGKPFLDGYEFVFRLESTNGAEITEFKYAYEEVKELI